MNLTAVGSQTTYVCDMNNKCAVVTFYDRLTDTLFTDAPSTEEVE